MLAGATFAPVPLSYKPVVTPLKAWRDFHDHLQSTATYRIFLTRMHQDNPPGTNPAFEPQIVWLVIARHGAFLPPPAPGTNYPRPHCAFGFCTGRLTPPLASRFMALQDETSALMINRHWLNGDRMRRVRYIRFEGNLWHDSLVRRLLSLL